MAEISNIGVVEGFFGPSWSFEARKSYAPFLKKVGGSFYIYAPKRDAFLRKAWREPWPANYPKALEHLQQHFQNSGIAFGVGFSPFGLGSSLTTEDKKLLQEKLKILADLKITYLGLFFDDMVSSPNLLEVQKVVVDLALNFFPQGLIFCPSYYSLDPILDKVFGMRPDGYVEGVGEQIPSSVAICWTGPKVISDEISKEHLLEVGKILKRKPFIWENIFANDGPKNCKFLKLKNFAGRDLSIVTETAGVGLNLMNQPYLSQLLFLQSILVIKGESVESALKKSCRQLLSMELSQALQTHRELFCDKGLEKINVETRNELMKLYGSFNDPFADEVVGWLKGDYLVGPECLTD